MKLLYIENDATAREYIQKGLREHGHVVDVAPDGRTGLERASSAGYDLLILDAMLPELDGFELVGRLRESGFETPVLFLSARGEVSERFRGLSLDADDYLSKPFAFAELLARIQALSRQRTADPQDGVLRIGDLELHLHRCCARRGGVEIPLTLKEFALVEYLMRNPGQVLSRAMILERIWGDGFDAHSNVIDAHVANLCKKIDRSFEPKLLHTVTGVGYVLEARG
jgi:two-component system OmpR family response regulator